MRVLLNSDISIISVHLKEVTQSENTGGLSSSLVQDTISTLSEVQAWGAGGRGFKSHWPQYVHGFIYLSSVIYDIIEPESEV
jgi:hypothetical protein